MFPLPLVLFIIKTHDMHPIPMHKLPLYIYRRVEHNMFQQFNFMPISNLHTYHYISRNVFEPEVNYTLVVGQTFTFPRSTSVLIFKDNTYLGKYPIKFSGSPTKLELDVALQTCINDNEKK